MFERLAEAKIQEAIRNGEFDNLPFGKSINLDYWASLPEDVRAGYMVLINSGCVPDEVHLLKEIGDLREQLADNTIQDKSMIIVKLREAELKYNLLKERRTQRK
ncbi:DUF1992 domain-containing protein [Dehalobacter sp. DCM]|uniref:DnaJ family domain-containing protein n=1 Tax=Dehalobacter sp. DCM TaxID=2907827 RepID=UPI00308170BA|nr:DUF1992 domain-containing protein [Dehalobacter sp. DCM]